MDSYLPGPSGLNLRNQDDTSSSSYRQSEVSIGLFGQRVHALASVAVAKAGGGSSTNGSSDTPKRPRKHVRRPETWKKMQQKLKRPKGKNMCHPPLVYLSQPERPDPSAVVCAESAMTLYRGRKERHPTAVQLFSQQGATRCILFGLISSQPVKRRRPRGESVKTWKGYPLLPCKFSHPSSGLPHLPEFATLHHLCFLSLSSLIYVPRDKRGKHGHHTRIADKSNSKSMNTFVVFQ